MSVTTIQVTGMTCEHCVKAVTEELTALPSVTAVDIDLQAGAASTVTVTSTAELEPAAVEAAIDEAGYTVASFSAGSGATR
jgi:copper chaperone